MNEKYVSKQKNEKRHQRDYYLSELSIQVQDSVEVMLSVKSGKETNISMR